MSLFQLVTLLYAAVGVPLGLGILILLYAEGRRATIARRLQSDDAVEVKR